MDIKLFPRLSSNEPLLTYQTPRKKSVPQRSVIPRGGRRLRLPAHLQRSTG